MATRVFLGSQGVLAPRVGAALVPSTQAGFHLFAAFYAVAFVIALGLLRPASPGPPAGAASAPKAGRG